MADVGSGFVIKNRTWASCIGSMESQPLDNRGIPPDLFSFGIPDIFCFQFLKKFCLPKTFLGWYLHDSGKLFHNIKHFSLRKVIESALLSGA